MVLVHNVKDVNNRFWYRVWNTYNNSYFYLVSLTYNNTFVSTIFCLGVKLLNFYDSILHVSERSLLNDHYLCDKVRYMSIRYSFSSSNSFYINALFPLYVPYKP